MLCLKLAPTTYQGAFPPPLYTTPYTEPMFSVSQTQSTISQKPEVFNEFPSLPHQNVWKGKRPLKTVSEIPDAGFDKT